MKVRCVSFAFVSAAFLAAFATNGSSALANSSAAQIKLTRDAYQSLQAGDADSAIQSYSKAIKSRALEPEVLANALLNRALAYQQKSSDEKAIADYTQALALDAMAPTLRATALYNRGLSRQKTGNLPGAVEDFTSALLLNAEFAHAYFSRANALRDSGQMLFALSDYERALRYKHPDATKVNYGIAVTYVALRRPADARKALSAVLAANPSHAGALDQLAKLGDTASLEAELAEADPVLTGSVAALSGGTSARKLTLPAAVDVPAEMQPALATAGKTKKKKFVDRVPMVEIASTAPATDTPVLDAAKGVEVAEVPAIPEPEQQTIEIASAPEPVAEEPATDSEVVAQPAATIGQVDGYAVQIASATSEDAAWSTWKKMQKRNKALQNLKPDVVKADLGGKGIFYRVRLQGFKNQSGAKAACGKLKSKGVDCYVSKT